MFAELGIYGAPQAKSILQYKPFIAMSSFTHWLWYIFFSALFRTKTYQPTWKGTVFDFEFWFSSSKCQQRKLFVSLYPAISLKPNFFSRSTRVVADNDDVMSKKTSRKHVCPVVRSGDGTHTLLITIYLSFGLCPSLSINQSINQYLFQDSITDML